MQYKRVRRPVRDIARALGVDVILEGSVTRSTSRVHLTVQLIHAATDTHIWAESYDRDLRAAFSLPYEVSQTIAKEVRLAVSSTVPQPHINPEAHDAYLHGRYALIRNTIDLKRAELILRALHIAVSDARRVRFSLGTDEMVREVPTYPAPPKPAPAATSIHGEPDQVTTPDISTAHVGTDAFVGPGGPAVSGRSAVASAADPTRPKPQARVCEAPKKYHAAKRSGTRA